ncbi:MAG: 7-cyano-7-deazaguanine synthase QueC [Planctomycetes bacterium]|nr:7-cyano-7-deazaguanine synthase QueC [Planctomycetota bacterium]
MPSDEAGTLCAVAHADPPRAVCLLSGGMDSAVTLAEARAAGFSTYALTVKYGQRHACELAAARRVAQALGTTEQREFELDLSVFGGSALTGRGTIPKGRNQAAITAGGVPATYVPARNTVFLALALAWAEALGARDLFLGVNAIDYSGYPDCRPEFLSAFEGLARLATAAGTEHGARFRVHAPLLALTKRDIVLRAEELGVDLGLTHSCYDPLEEGGLVLACGGCDACSLRLKGFREAGRRDPIAYVEPRPAVAGRGSSAPSP